MSKRNTALDMATEITDDIEVIGPGHMLAEGRKALNLSQADVAEKLNFRLTLVKEIEQEIFDKSLPDTFNRGYLRNYAKLVKVNEQDVLASYETLNIAEQQCAEMQSFSQQTKKQAEHSRLMWITYVILALVVGSSLVWYFQYSDSTETVIEPVSVEAPELVSETNQPQASALDSATSDNSSPVIAAENAEENVLSESVELKQTVNVIPENNEVVPNTETTIPDSNALEENTSVLTEQTSAQLTTETNVTQVSFLFSGDCWVNIYDATGERIAWGVKKTDYEMNISGVPPFKVTLGKPELVKINYQGENVDMSQFARGNIAKFTLPLAVN